MAICRVVVLRGSDYVKKEKEKNENGNFGSQ